MLLMLMLLLMLLQTREPSSYNHWPGGRGGTVRHPRKNRGKSSEKKKSPGLRCIRAAVVPTREQAESDGRSGL